MSWREIASAFLVGCMLYLSRDIGYRRGWADARRTYRKAARLDGEGSES